MTAISQVASLQKREPSFFTAKNGMSAMEPGPASKSCCTLEPQASSMQAPAHTIIFWPSPVLFCSLR